MTKTMSFDDFLAKIGKDRNFRMELLQNPEVALKKAGVHPTPEMIKALKGINRHSLEAVAKAFSGGAVHADTMMC